MKSPAKINLTLEILGQRPDGFHQLSTWMVPIDLMDNLELSFAPATSFTVAGAALPFDESNLVYRALHLFREATSAKGEYRIRLTKQIPIGAGLAGGSSNGATTLLALNELHGQLLDTATLEQLAARLGSDAAFFIRCRPALCRGRGEIMEPKRFPDPAWVFLAKPAFGVQTKQAYALYAALPPAERRGPEQQSPWGILRNDLERPVFRKFPILAVIKDWLRRRPKTLSAMMSGSGSTMYAITTGPEESAAIEAAFQKEFGPNFWTATCRVIP
jgi:4-diphosphocytidyl-2-C-methyl-D-erythritol kinase